jgi:hypothetical protein
MWLPQAPGLGRATYNLLGGLAFARLDLTRPEAELLRPLPPGSLAAEWGRVGLPTGRAEMASDQRLSGRGQDISLSATQRLCSSFKLARTTAIMPNGEPYRSGSAPKPSGRRRIARGARGLLRSGIRRRLLLLIPTRRPAPTASHCQALVPKSPRRCVTARRPPCGGIDGCCPRLWENALEVLVAALLFSGARAGRG